MYQKPQFLNNQYHHQQCLGLHKGLFPKLKRKSKDKDKGKSKDKEKDKSEDSR